MKTQLADDPINTSSKRSQRSPSSLENNHAVRTALQLKRILVPIDFSGCSKKALQYAVGLAQDYQASVVLIHIVQSRTASSQLLQERKMELETLARQEVPGHVPVSTLVRVGEPLREIIDVARIEFADLLLVSTHGRAGLPDFCLNSAAEQIVRYAPCPVLVVRAQEHDFLCQARPSGLPNPEPRQRVG